MQCSNAKVHCKVFVEDSSLSHIPSSQSEYFTHWELVVFYDKKVIWIDSFEPMLF